MKLRAAFLARSAKVNADGTFDVEGGGATDFFLTQGLIIGAPIRLTFAILLRLEVDESEIERLVPINLDLMFEGQRLGGGMLPLVGRKVAGETRYYHNAVLNLTVDVPRPGDGEVRFTWEQGLASIPPLHFRVGQRSL